MFLYLAINTEAQKCGFISVMFWLKLLLLYDNYSLEAGNINFDYSTYKYSVHLTACTVHSEMFFEIKTSCIYFLYLF